MFNARSDNQAIGATVPGRATGGRRGATCAGRRGICAGTLAAAVLLTGAPAAAQDEFGRMVAVSGATVIVGKPGAARGPAALYRFERDRSGAWVLMGTFSPPDAAGNGHRLAPSLQWKGERLIVGSGDPDVRFGAHLFQHSRDGLVYERGLELVRPPSTGPAAAHGGPGAAAVDFAGIMRILQPPTRTVALQRDRIAVSVTAEGAEPGGVHVYQRSGRRGWSAPTVLPLPGPASEYPDFGTALAVNRDAILVASPGAEGDGRVFVYRPRDSELGNVTIGPPDSLEAGARFGAALAVEGSRLLIGAPGARHGSGLVHAYRRVGNGEWEFHQLLTPGSPEEGMEEVEMPGADDVEDAGAVPEPEAAEAAGAFGTTLALLGDELWVGAPRERSGAGRVHRFMLIDGDWQAAALDVPEARPDAALGSAVAIGTSAAVVGAPGTDGGYGAALVFRRDPGGPWSDPEWLRPGPGPDAVTEGEVRCDEGAAAGFSCEGVDLLAFLPTSAIGGEPWERVSDVWGWTDPETGREYALVGRSGGAAIVDVTDPGGPALPGRSARPTPVEPATSRSTPTTSSSPATGPATTDSSSSTSRVRLRDRPSRTASQFQPDAVYRGIASAHNLGMDAESGFAFPVGASGVGGETCGGGLHMVDVRDPKSPVFAGCFTDTLGLIAPGPHPRRPVRGVPRPRRTLPGDGRSASHRTRACSGSSTSPTRRRPRRSARREPPRASRTSTRGGSPTITATTTSTTNSTNWWARLPGDAHLHLRRRRTRRPDPGGQRGRPSGATDHNLYVKGDRMYQANYQAGFRLLDISDPEAPVEIGWFDTTPYEGRPTRLRGRMDGLPLLRERHGDRDQHVRGSVPAAAAAAAADSRRQRDRNMPRTRRAHDCQRRRADSNRRMEVLQTSALPLGYGADTKGAPGNGRRPPAVRGTIPTGLRTDSSRDCQPVYQSGKPDSNRRPPPWQGGALPTELFPQGLLVRGNPAFRERHPRDRAAPNGTSTLDAGPHAVKRRTPVWPRGSPAARAALSCLLQPRGAAVRTRGQRQTRMRRAPYLNQPSSPSKKKPRHSTGGVSGRVGSRAAGSASLRHARTRVRGRPGAVLATRPAGQAPA